MSAIADRVTAREPLPVGDGKSGSRLERWLLDDGSAVVVKTISPAWDWIMRATRDDGRIALLWRSGILEAVPRSIDHAVLGVEPAGDGWAVVMRDVSHALVPAEEQLSRARSRHVMRAAADLHEAFFGRPLPGLCSLADLYGLLTPRVAAAQEVGEDAVPRIIGRGWERFAEVVPEDVSAPVHAVLDEPALLARALSERPCTLIHGDLKLGNLGFDGGRVVVLDWGTQTAVAPPAVEYAWYLAINASRIDASHDELLDDARAAMAARRDDKAVRLALFGAVVQLGWDKALQATESTDPAVRERERADLDWWVARARETLETWTPT